MSKISVISFNLLFFRGQPALWDNDPGEKHIVYESFCADGSCLPPVIFTNKPIKTGILDFNLGKAFVHYVPDVKGPGNYTTQVYIEDMSNQNENYFADKPHMIFDSLKAHTSNDVLQDWKDNEVTTHQITGSAGKWLNPCDNIINREFRRNFNALQQQKPNNKLNNIVEAYYAISETTIIHSFQRCGLFKGDPRRIIQKFESEGFNIEGRYKDEFNEMWRSYIIWLKKNFRNTKHFKPCQYPLNLDVEGLDGTYWKNYGKK